jgi:DNA-binding LacI/PurR family transcriptional regulator
MQDEPLNGITTKKKYTSFDIALIAGVSQPTVSRALNGSKSVTESTRQRIIEIAQSLDYQVDLRARRLRTQQTGAITLLMFADDVSQHSKLNPFFLAMLGAITRAASDRGYDLLVAFQQLSKDWFADYEKSRKSDGLILLGYGNFEELDQRLVQLVEQGTHFIRWGAVRAGHPGIAVGCNNIVGAKHATQHLIKLGRQRIAFLGDVNATSPEFYDRFLGYREALTEAQLPYDSAMQINACLTEQRSGIGAIEQLLKKRLAFDAIVAASDQIAIAAIRALTAAGISVPNDVAVVGFDDIPLASMMNPPLTTVRQDTDRAGELLVDNLIKQINQKPVGNVILDTDLIVRESCGAYVRP